MKNEKGSCVNLTDALKAYWEFQNGNIKQLENYAVQGGSFSDKLTRATEEFQRNGMVAYEQMMRGQ